MGHLSTLGVYLEDPARNIGIVDLEKEAQRKTNYALYNNSVEDPNIQKIKLKDEPEKSRGKNPLANHMQQSVTQGAGAGDIQKLMELYSGKTMSDFLAESPLSPDEAFQQLKNPFGTPGIKPPTESYRFDILQFGNEEEKEKCTRRQFPGNWRRHNGTDK
tara:strand:- start:21299 stop:21778 length:480 start_codon:yes stop_codon:yes gene_type:complete